MFSVASLLNPVTSEPPRAVRLPPSPSSSFCTTVSSHASPRFSAQSSLKKQKMTKDGAIFVKGKIKGEVNYPPFQQFDEETLCQVQQFGVTYLGEIEEYPRHIPYNSEKKSFLEKTGRESFEVFQYTFIVPGDEKDYIVMWDYNIGLVRITPFFKCCKYSKTTPAKMLNMNPGLKEITHSITGGALAAQGYWMPYSCALAVCATFCSHIAGALIPLFGPTFPSQCVLPEAPEHGRMIISPSLIAAATSQAEAYRLQYSTASFTPTSNPRDSYSPSRLSPPSNLLQTPVQHNKNSTPPDLGHRLRLKRAFGRDSPYTDSGDHDSTSSSSSTDGYYCSPGTPSSLSLSRTWTARNLASHTTNSSINIEPTKVLAPSPWLSAVPRSSCLDVEMSGMEAGTGAGSRLLRSKRRAEEVSDGCSETEDPASATDITKDDSTEKENTVVGGAEKKAAWLLMRLSVKDGEVSAEGGNVDEQTLVERPRVKRQRAMSV